MAGVGSGRRSSKASTVAAASVGGGSRPRYAPEDPTLPKPWKALVDGSTGELYYWNPESSVTQYERPEPDLPKPWKALVDGSTGELYYWNPESSVTQYERPEPDLPPPPSLLPPPPPRPPTSSKSFSSQLSGPHDRKRGQETSDRDRDRDRERDRDHRRPTESHDDDDYRRSPRSHHQHGDGRGSNTQNKGHSMKDSRDSKISSSRVPLSSDIAGSSSAEAYRRQHEIFVTGDNVPAPYMTFESADFPSEILKEVQHAGFSCPTPIQAQAWPLALQNRDIVVIAKTGSGKTLGYLIPGFIHLKHLRNNSKVGPTVLVLAPTRELATQIQDEAVKFGRSSKITCTCLYGGGPKRAQLRDIQQGVDIVVATPERLIYFLEMRKISLCQVLYLVLDEADRMLDMSFESQIRTIVKEVPHRHQTLMFTATWSKEVRKFAADLLVNHVQVNIGSTDELVANNAITQHVEVIMPSEKQRRLEQILRSQDPGSKVIIFCSTTIMCDQLTRIFARQFGAAAIHGGKSQSERDRVLSQFRSGRSPILVTTDVAARGLGIKDIRVVVINYEFPRGVKDYVHRIERTGKAGAGGVSYTFFCQQDYKFAADLVNILEGANQRVPRELRDMVAHSGFGGRSCRWRVSGSDSREHSHNLPATSSRLDGGLGFRGTGNSESSHDRYDRGYDDGHKVDAHGRTTKSRGRSHTRSRSRSRTRSRSRSRIRSYSYSHGRRGSPGPRNDVHARHEIRPSRRRSRSISRSRSSSHGTGRNLDFDAGPKDMDHVEVPRSGRPPSPSPNPINRAGYDRGYDDGHKVDAHGRTTKSRGRSHTRSRSRSRTRSRSRSRIRSYSYSHGRRGSPGPRNDVHARHEIRPSRRRSRSISRSRSSSHGTGRNLDFDAGQKDMDHVDVTRSGRPPSPSPNPINRAGYDRGYDDGHKVDAHGRTTKSRGRSHTRSRSRSRTRSRSRSRIRSYSYSHGRRGSPGPRNDVHARHEIRPSRRRSRSISRSQSSSHGTGRNLDFDAGPKDMDHVDVTRSGRPPSPSPNPINRAGYSKTTREVQLDHLANAQNESGLQNDFTKEEVQKTGNSEMCHENSSLINGTKNSTEQSSDPSRPLPLHGSSSEELEEGMIVEDEDDDNGMTTHE